MPSYEDFKKYLIDHNNSPEQRLNAKRELLQEESDNIEEYDEEPNDE